MKTIAQVIRADDAAEGAPALPAVAQQTTPIAPPPPVEQAPPPITPPPPPPPDPPTVSLGQTKDEVVASFGQPVRIANLGTKQILYYKDLKVTLINGKVTAVE